MIRRTIISLICFCVASQLAAIQRPADVQPLRRAHAHNDYEHNRPLLDAIDHGFCSVEADIFLIDGHLLVGHDRWSLSKDRTLEKLYLNPLLKQVKSNKGKVYPHGPVFRLLIDIKNNGQNVYLKLKEVLKNYESMLSGMQNGRFVRRAVQIIISGDCPRSLIRNDENRLVGIDGRLSDLESDEPANLIPMISARWGSNFKWRGKSKITAAESKKLRSIVSKAHRADRVVRFWATPESTIVWDQLVANDVDLINTDKLAQLQDYLIGIHQNGKPEPQPRH